MNISANNSINGNVNTTFGKEYKIEDAEHIARLTEELKDSFIKGNEGKEVPEMKSFAGICASAIGAVLTTFVIGKCAASKVMTAFPGLTSKASNYIRKNANFVRDYADDVANGIKLKKGGKYTKAAAEGIGKAEKFAREKFISLRDKMGTEGIISNMAGAAAIASVAPEILSVDGNKDGISDIAQRNVNAYKNAAQNIGIISEVVNALA